MTNRVYLGGQRSIAGKPVPPLGLERRCTQEGLQVRFGLVVRRDDGRTIHAVYRCEYACGKKRCEDKIDFIK